MTPTGLEALAIILTFFTIILVVAIIGGIIHKKMKIKESRLDKFTKEYELRLESIEDRLANIETITLEKEKDRKFSAL